jgi:cupin fold WbuC family metalloprotein
MNRISPFATQSRYDRAFAVDQELIQRKIADACANARGREMHVLHGSGSDPVQRMLNALQPSSYIRPHRHIQPPKSETVILLHGALAFVTFLDDGTPDTANLIRLHPSIALAVDCREGVWHTFFALEPDTVVFEIKAGPHDAATDKEPAPWAPAENSPEAQSYFENLRSLFGN